MNRRLFALCHERIRHTLIGNVGYLSCGLWCSRHNVSLSVNGFRVYLIMDWDRKKPYPEGQHYCRASTVK